MMTVSPQLRSVGLLLGPLFLLGTGLWLQPEESRVPYDVARYADHPPLAHTGGFGEPTCRACHFGDGEEELEGTLMVDGVSSPVHSGRTTELTITLRAEMERSGFMLAVRDSDGTQAGRLSPGDTARVAVHTVDSTNVQYAHHTLSGTDVRQPKRAVWRVHWTAPETATDSVLVHVSANAANDDASEFGDNIYTTTVRTHVEQ